MTRATRPITESEESAPLDRAYLRSPRVPMDLMSALVDARAFNPPATLPRYGLRPVGSPGPTEFEFGLATARLRAQLLSYSVVFGTTRVIDIVDERGMLVETVRP